jgi:hypothetical protein
VFSEDAASPSPVELRAQITMNGGSIGGLKLSCLPGAMCQKCVEYILNL